MDSTDSMATGRSTALVAVGTVAALGSGWAGLAVDRAQGRRGGMEGPGSLAWLVLPLAAMTATAPRRALRGIVATADPRWLRGHGRDAVLALAVFPTIAVATCTIGTLSGGMRLRPGAAASIVRSTRDSLGSLLVKNVAEELTWRAVLTEQLMRDPRVGAEHDDRIATGVGALWGAWHLPYYVGFLDADIVRHVRGDENRVRLMFEGALGTAVWAPLFTEVHRRTRSLWIPVVMHSLGNLVISALVLDGAAEYRRWGRVLFSPVSGIVPMALVLGAAHLLRAGRRRRDLSGR